MIQTSLRGVRRTAWGIAAAGVPSSWRWCIGAWSNILLVGTLCRVVALLTTSKANHSRVAGNSACWTRNSNRASRNSGARHMVPAPLRLWCWPWWLCRTQSGVAGSTLLHHAALAVLSGHLELAIHHNSSIGERLKIRELHGHQNNLQLIMQSIQETVLPLL